MSINSKARIILAAWIIGLALVPALTAVQEPVDTEKLYAEISGEWEFESQGQYLYVKFYSENGQLYGIGEGDAEGTLCEPDETEPMTFNANHVNGNLYVLKFKKGEEGRITVCELTVGGIVAAGKKIKD